jgi:AmmeMemoRadiSam system protein B
VDREAVDAALDLDQVVAHDAAHAPEHSLEVHLPFLQVVLEDFQVVPLVVGEAATSDVAGVIERLWGGPETVIVVSTDLSHYQDYETAQAMDRETAEAIERLDGDALHGHRACGFVGLQGLLEVARRRGLEIERLDLRNSADTAGPADRVVGYGAWAFTEPRSAA